MSVNALPACTSHACLLLIKVKRDVRYPETRVIDSCEQLHGC